MQEIREEMGNNNNQNKLQRNIGVKLTKQIKWENKEHNKTNSKDEEMEVHEEKETKRKTNTNETMSDKSDK